MFVIAFLPEMHLSVFLKKKTTMKQNKKNPTHLK